MGSVSERDSESIVDSEIVDSRGGDNSRSTAIHYRLSAIYFRSLPVRRRARAGLVVLEQGDQRRIAGAQGLVDRGAAGAGADVGVGAALEQQPRDRRVALARREVQRRRAVAVGDARARPGV